MKQKEVYQTFSTLELHDESRAPSSINFSLAMSSIFMLDAASNIGKDNRPFAKLTAHIDPLIYVILFIFLDLKVFELTR